MKFKHCAFPCFNLENRRLNVKKRHKRNFHHRFISTHSKPYTFSRCIHVRYTCMAYIVSQEKNFIKTVLQESEMTYPMPLKLVHHSGSRLQWQSQSYRYLQSVRIPIEHYSVVVKRRRYIRSMKHLLRRWRS